VADDSALPHPPVLLYRGMAKKRTPPKAGPAKIPADSLPQGYAELLGWIKERIRSAQLRASLAINREMVLLYWQIGREILTRQEREGWGTKVIDRLAVDLRRGVEKRRHRRGLIPGGR
jgi:hypothetical protein